ncbi:hypothetical protein [Bdellovibrio sp. HCB-162]|uniref:hypothetical protein n=1 Tax=Bdellovibrio sp. HCB-162 TaxID=3394234 RepID=UPI0039BD48F9
MKNILITLSTILFLQPVLAHEGHETPGVIKAVHGGTALPGKEINLEYMVSGTELKIYPVSHEGKDLNASQVKVSATAKAPKGKAENLKLENKDGAFVTQVDFKNAYRLEVNVTTETSGKKDSFKFQVEK